MFASKKDRTRRFRKARAQHEATTQRTRQDARLGGTALFRDSENEAPSIATAFEKCAGEARKWTSQAARATPKSTKIRLNVARGRSRPPWVAPGSAGNAPGRARNGRWTPSWVVLGAMLAVLGAMLAVLGAMLAVWDAKLTARGAPRTLRSARGARLCRHSASETRSQRIHTRLVLRTPQFLQCLPPVWAILPRAAVMREKPRKSRRFGFQNRVRGPFERASRARKRPVRAKKFARSACGASENLKVSANESTSSE